LANAAGKMCFFDGHFKNSMSVFRVNRRVTDFLVVTRENADVKHAEHEGGEEVRAK